MKFQYWHIFMKKWANLYIFSYVRFGESSIWIEVCIYLYRRCRKMKTILETNNIFNIHFPKSDLKYSRLACFSYALPDSSLQPSTSWQKRPFYCSRCTLTLFLNLLRDERQTYWPWKVCEGCSCYKLYKLPNFMVKPPWNPSGIPRPWSLPQPTSHTHGRSWRRRIVVVRRMRHRQTDTDAFSRCEAVPALKLNNSTQ